MRTLLFLLLSGITSFAVADQDAMQKLNALLADPAAQQQAYVFWPNTNRHFNERQ